MIDYLYFMTRLRLCNHYYNAQVLESKIVINNATEYKSYIFFKTLNNIVVEYISIFFW